MSERSLIDEADDAPRTWGEWFGMFAAAFCGLAAAFIVAVFIVAYWSHS